MGFGFHFVEHRGLEQVFSKAPRPAPKAHSDRVQIHEEELKRGGCGGGAGGRDTSFHLNIRPGHQALI